MHSRMRTTLSCRLKKGFSLKYPDGCPDIEIPEEGWRTQELKCLNDKI